MSDSLLGYEFLSAQNLRCKKLLVIGHCIGDDEQMSLIIRFLACW